jgi:hypothetical protein
MTIEPRRLARATDPRTSKDAAADVLPRLGELQAFVLQLVKATPGLTSNELARRHHINDPRTVNRRLGELEGLGLVVRGTPRPCDVSGKAAATWEPAQLSDGAGRDRGTGTERQYPQQSPRGGKSSDDKPPPAGMLFDNRPAPGDASRL